MHNITLISAREANSIKLEVQVGDKTYPIFFRSPDVTLTANTEALLACILLPAMSSGEGTINLNGGISQRLLTSLPTIQDIYCAWLPSYRRVDLANITPVVRNASPEGRTAAFFSAGVDSGYTLLKHQEQITDLVLIHGLETHLDNSFLRERLSTNVRKIAASFGKNVIEIETNLRELYDPYVNFGHWGFGIALMTVSHLLSSVVRRVYIPGGRTYLILSPAGSHPLLDPLWSTEGLDIVYDGLEMPRVEKAAQVAQHDILLNTLHVCHRNYPGIYNCGACEKCVRTMVNLEAVGALNRCAVFEASLNLKSIRQLNMTDLKFDDYLKENLDFLDALGGNAELRKALRQALNRPLWLRKFMRQVGRYKKGFAKRFSRRRDGQ